MKTALATSDFDMSQISRMMRQALDKPRISAKMVSNKVPMSAFVVSFFK